MSRNKLFTVFVAIFIVIFIFIIGYVKISPREDSEIVLSTEDLGQVGIDSVESVSESSVISDNSVSENSLSENSVDLSKYDSHEVTSDYATITDLYDSYILSLFDGVSSDIEVSKDLVGTIEPAVASVSPDGGFSNRQLDIRNSGVDVTVIEGVETLSYINICEVFCLDNANSTFTYTVVIKLQAVDGVITSFNILRFT